MFYVKSQFIAAGEVTVDRNYIKYNLHWNMLVNHAMGKTTSAFAFSLK